MKLFRYALALVVTGIFRTSAVDMHSSSHKPANPLSSPEGVKIPEGVTIPPGVELIGDIQVDDQIPQVFKLGPGAVLSQEIQVNGEDLWVKVEARSDQFERFQIVEYAMRHQNLIYIARRMLKALLNYDSKLDEVFNLFVEYYPDDYYPQAKPKTSKPSLAACLPCLQTPTDGPEPAEQYPRIPSKTGEMKFKDLAKEFKEIFDASDYNQWGKNKSDFARVWQSLNIGAISANPLKLSDQAFAEFNAEQVKSGSTPGEFDYFAKYLFEKGAKLFNDYQSVHNAVGNDLERMNYLEQNWTDFETILPGLMRIAVDPKRYATARVLGLEGYHEYIVYITTNKDFTFSKVVPGDDAGTTMHPKIRQYFKDFDSVLGYVTLSTKAYKKEKYLTQRGINSSLLNLMKAKRVQIALILTEFAGVVGHVLNPEAKELYIRSALPGMSHLIRKNLDQNKYRAVGDTFYIPVPYLCELWAENYPPDLNAKQADREEEGVISI